MTPLAACGPGPKISRANPIRRLPLAARCKPPPGDVTELVGWWVRHWDLLRERVSRTACDKLRSYHHTLRCSVFMRSRGTWAMLLCQDKHPSTNFDCLYRMYLTLTSRLHAWLPIWAVPWAEYARVSSHLLLSTSTTRTISCRVPLVCPSLPSQKIAPSCLLNAPLHLRYSSYTSTSPADLNGLQPAGSLKGLIFVARDAGLSLAYCITCLV